APAWPGYATTTGTSRRRPRRQGRRLVRSSGNSIPSRISRTITLCPGRNDVSETHPGGCAGDAIRSEIARRATYWLCLGAAPTFAITALLTGALGRTESHRFQDAPRVGLDDAFEAVDLAASPAPPLPLWRGDREARVDSFSSSLHHHVTAMS